MFAMAGYKSTFLAFSSALGKDAFSKFQEVIRPFYGNNTDVEQEILTHLLHRKLL